MKTKNIAFLLLLFSFALSVTAQQKLTKMSKQINVSKDVEIDLNTSYVEIEIDTWNKNILEIEAYIEDEKMSKEELQQALKQWNLKVEGSGDYVKISSEGAFPNWNSSAPVRFDLEDLNINIALAEMPELPELPEMPELPELPELPEMERFEMKAFPELPEIPKLPKGIKNVSFDTEAYEKEGDAYLDRWSKEFDEKYQDEMKAWGKEMAKVDFSKYEKEMEKWGERFGEEYGKKMEAWGREFELRFDDKWAEKMEAWGEKYGKEMEQRARVQEQRIAERQDQIAKRQAEIGKRVEERNKEREERLAQMELRLADRQKAREERQAELAKRLKLIGGDKVKKTIKIKMPKKAKLNMNVRHGELKLGSVIHNLKADISHAVLVANHIDGKETSINVAYSPVDIVTWSLGQLNLKYVEEAQIQNIGRLVLNSNSSDIILANIMDNAIIDGSFGELAIANIADSFSNLNIILENSDALISLPKSDYSVFFKGNRSKLNNKMTSQKTIENNASGNSSGKSIVVNAKYSDVVLR
ncbi:hypothetical protein AB9K26_05905 [Psychroserpens sp. XS_ASV72]|uniref:hypothetical protein n=1 Tax=Psychroserpens sp. XS_ASV72 TaxID=3241293 RepID=UPI00351776F9